ncbi:MAG: chemotaxis response regulator protein-glutamate methylesterase [Oscillospiraceae bacterium]|jgi:two-component system chemotaxis response regulator CheB|nr:chemotaxis response regulator protein-glutamate methylesterase [Oscillospiraceae bacterium]
MAKKIRLLIVDDSIIFRTMLTKSLNAFDEIEVVGTASDAFEAKDKIIQLKPDVITLDVEMPKLNGIDFLKQILPKYPIPTIVVTSSPINAFDAISAGAVEFIKKPTRAETDVFIAELGKKVVIASNARVRRISAASLKTDAPMSIAALASGAGSKKIIAIGASTGGTEALASVLENLPKSTPGIIVVQHMPAGFTKMYADRLNRVCNMDAREAVDGDRVQQGLILVAAGEFHLRLHKDARGYYISSKRGDKVSGHCPSVDVMFDSVAEVAKNNAIGIILTGMGADGAQGLLKMKKAGAYTIGQDKETCVVYGMPMVAFNIGGVMKQAPLQAIPKIMMDSLK